MNVVKVVFEGKSMTETVVVRDLSPSVARLRAQNLNDSRDTGSEDADESAIVSYIAK